LVLPVFLQVKFGLKLGANTATVPEYDISTGTTNIEAVKKCTVGHTGRSIFEGGIKSVFIQPEIMLASNSYDYTVTTVNRSGSSSPEIHPS